MSAIYKNGSPVAVTDSILMQTVADNVKVATDEVRMIARNGWIEK